MKREKLAEESNTFADCAEDVLSRTVADRSAKRRLDFARRRLIRSIARLCHSLTNDQLVLLADYVLLITA